MAIVPLKEILARAFEERYGVAAFNIVNDLTLEAVLEAASRCGAPVIVQTSVKTVRAYGADVLFALWREMASRVDVPVTLHLDHCPDRRVISECLRRGWNSVLFDGSSLPLEENARQTREVVEEARTFGAHVEGEIETITGVEDGVGSDAVGATYPLDAALEFIRFTGVDVFAPAIGNAHGLYRATPTLDLQRVSDLVEKEQVPIALHGGTGMSKVQFRELVARGCAKVNISTALKRSFMQASHEYLVAAAEEDHWDPPSLFAHASAGVIEMARAHIETLGSVGKAAR